MGTLTLNGLLPTIYNAMEVISREQIGMIPAVSRDSNAERAAINETVRSPSVGPMVAEDLTPGAYAPDTPNQTINYVDMTIQKARSVPFGITGEENRGLNNAGTLGDINAQRITQALRTLGNEVEADLAALHIYASRAYGTANVTPFGTAADFTDFSNPLRILDDNGAPLTDRQMVLGSSAISNIRGKQSGLFKANEANSDELLRRGIIGQVEGWDIHNSGQIRSLVPAGTAAASTTNAAGYAVGATVINLAAAGTGAYITGDIVTFAGDADNKYLLAAGDADTSNGGTIVLAEPGLRKAIPAAATAITVIAATTRNMFFHRSAIQLACRAPAMPDEGDSADDVMMVTDPVSGITYEFCIYKQKRQVRYEVNLAWGVKAVAPRHMGILIGA
ncbi:P22 phage major capsid protein family protein [Janthinobacterium sp. MDT1-19]|uniref:P22 phage major capsid protein family protein n=1 Tax=Janthinobacterium sp. MDT1-19 TaxID=1259339 RepID=UPI003F260051